MAVTLKKVVTMIALAFVLLGGVAGGTIRAEAVMSHHATAISTTHQMALGHSVVCPPPPYWCE